MAVAINEKYAIKSNMFDHTPNSLCSVLLVNRSVKIIPVATLIILAAKKTKPEYWSLISSLVNRSPNCWSLHNRL
jgi:hypothetical protein